MSQEEDVHPLPGAWASDEPSTIWTRLRVGRLGAEKIPSPYSSYRYLSPSQRLTYLNWLACDNLDDSVPASYATLYYLGLERKMFSSQYEQAKNEIMLIRSLYQENYLLLKCSEHVFFASLWFQNEPSLLADLLKDGVYDASGFAFQEALLYFLLKSKMTIALPLNWIVRWISDSAQKKEEPNFQRLHLLSFSENVDRLLHRFPLQERFESGCRKAKAVETIKWQFANKSESFPQPKDFEYKPVFSNPDFMRDFVRAWEESKDKAKEDLRKMNTRRMEEKESERERALKQVTLLDSYKMFDIGYHIRQALSLADKGETDLAKERLEELLKLPELSADRRAFIKRIIAHLNA